MSTLVGAVSKGGRNEEDDLETKQRVVLPPLVHDTVQKDEGLIVSFPTGMHAIGKHSLCQELLNIPGGFGDGRPVHSLSGSLATDGLGEGEFWDRVTSVRRRNQFSVLLADKYAESWGKVSQICRNTRAVAIPVIPDSEG
ncbi:hypothetical protein KPL70_024358 [Citrus sinensis]|nr:hypothetical protein KPL70_024358 [Citrus sinensis]